MICLIISWTAFILFRNLQCVVLQKYKIVKRNYEVIQASSLPLKIWSVPSSHLPCLLLIYTRDAAQMLVSAQLHICRKVYTKKNKKRRIVLPGKISAHCAVIKKSMP